MMQRARTWTDRILVLGEFEGFGNLGGFRDDRGRCWCCFGAGLGCGLGAASDSASGSASGSVSGSASGSVWDSASGDASGSPLRGGAPVSDGPGVPNRPGASGTSSTSGASAAWDAWNARGMPSASTNGGSAERRPASGAHARGRRAEGDAGVPRTGREPFAPGSDVPSRGSGSGSGSGTAPAGSGSGGAGFSTGWWDGGSGGVRHRRTVRPMPARCLWGTGLGGTGLMPVPSLRPMASTVAAGLVPRRRPPPTGRVFPAFGLSRPVPRTP